MSESPAYLLYDGECPFCAAYVRYARLREAAGPVALIDAREGGEEARRARRLGYDLDEGMLLHLNGVDHHGADCLNRLALLSTRSGAFNRLNAWAFRRPSVARLAYPVLRAGRGAALRLLGRSPIGPPPPG